MPSTNKRINLTVPDELYQRLKDYMSKNGFTSDATACLQLITRQLSSQKHVEAMIDMFRNLDEDAARRIFNEGFTLAKQLPTKDEKR